MKQFIIVGLICLNVALVAALVFHASTPAAQAQVRGGGSDYTMLTGRLEDGLDTVYVIDLSSRRMLAWAWDVTNKRLVPVQGRRLVDDFRGGSR
jgi:hypothetical protein